MLRNDLIGRHRAGIWAWCLLFVSAFLGPALHKKKGGKKLVSQGGFRNHDSLPQKCGENKGWGNIVFSSHNKPSRAFFLRSSSFLLFFVAKLFFSVLGYKGILG